MQVAVVLGCPARRDCLPPAALRRLGGVESLLRASGPEGMLIVTSGGRSWDHGLSTEADVFAAELARRIPGVQVLRERRSMNTQDNALYSVALLARHGLSPSWVVTCDTHAPRAAWCFERLGQRVKVVAVPSPAGPRKLVTRGLERLRLRTLRSRRP